MAKTDQTHEERSRLEELSSFDLLDSPADAFFDAMTQTAASICDAPIAYLSILDRKRQWFKSRVGIDLNETSRKSAFIPSPANMLQELIVPDTLLDKRFATNPMVTGAPNIRAYAGFPLITKRGLVLGHLCVVHQAPYQITPSQLEQLKLLTDAIMEHLEMRRQKAVIRGPGAELKSFIEHSPSAMALFDKDMHYISCSRRWAEDFGLGDEDLTGLNQYDLLPEVGEDGKTINDKCLRGAIERRKRYPFERADGTIQYLNFEIRPWFDQDENISGLVMYTEDVTREVETLNTLKNAEARLDSALLISGSAAWEVDIQSGKIHYSSNLENFLGRPPKSDEVFSDIWRFIHKDDRDGLKALWADHMNGAAPLEADHRYIKENGESVWARSTVELQRDENGKPLKVVGMSHDISERKAEELAIATAHQLAQEASDAKSTFLATISHEIKTPVYNIGGFASLLMKSDNLSDTERRQAKVIHKACRMLESIVIDVLDITTIQAKGLKLRPHFIDLSQLVKDIHHLFTERAAEKGLDLELHIDETLAQEIFIDSARTHQVISNLVNNAVKFTSNGSVKLRIDVIHKDDGLQTIRFMVEDTGEGIADDQLELIFDEFHQVDRFNRIGAVGVGIGLSVCRGLVDLMGGTLQVISQQGIGSKFWFDLDLETRSTTKPRASANLGTSVSMSAAASNLGGHHILMVDDHDLNHELMRSLLEPLGCHLTPAYDGQTAVDICRDQTFDLVLMDIRMPGMDGIETTRAIRDIKGDWTSIPILALTANVAPMEIDNYFDAGMNDIIEKSSVQTRLFQAMKRWLPDATSQDRSVDTQLVQAEKSDIQTKYLAQLEYFIELASAISNERMSLENSNFGAICHQISGISGALGYDEFAGITSGLDLKLRNHQPISRSDLLESIEAGTRAARGS